ncbi:hypothetical protein SLEP1_g24907 [Rubroshorea leprosula]|uniref:Uncharacterized protein n=1 Tax=Rubroshorea leprosula TaxID=152421 RepID=A0AAV5JRK4_9ROSI|nr:hypothetical protein SLEP1_g24907 [Rubroshorea leprosula]
MLEFFDLRRLLILYLGSIVYFSVQKDPKVRQSALKLLEHPFVNMYDDLDVDLSSYFTDVGSPLASL